MEFHPIEIDETNPDIMSQMRYHSVMLYRRKGFVTMFVDMRPEMPKASVTYVPGWDVMVVSDVRVHPYNTSIYFIDCVCKDKCLCLVFRRVDIDKYIAAIGDYSCYGRNRFRKAHPFPKVFLQYAKEFANYIRSLDRPRMAQIDKLTWQQRLDLRKAQLETNTPISPRTNKRKTKPQS